MFTAETRCFAFSLAMHEGFLPTLGIGSSSVASLVSVVVPHCGYDTFPIASDEHFFMSILVIGLSLEKYLLGPFSGFITLIGNV